jgi:hypothetical protein
VTEGTSTGAPSQPVRCLNCVFWLRLHDSEGVCRRRAPESGSRSEEVAHWPHTRGYQGCGDGAAALAPGQGSQCGECAFWHRPDQGFSPVDRGDMPWSWWVHAGYCVRHAPRPASGPGIRAFWRATSNADWCGEGAPQQPGAAAAP